MIETDYLIIGAGAVGMIFADQPLSETGARIALVDRRAMPGGHWNEAYSFVRLHQPSAFYGVGSRNLGSNRIDESGLNKGYYELASGAEVRSYFDAVMRERFLPSGRVQYFPMSDHVGGGKIVSRLTGEMQTIRYRKLVDATFFNTEIPSAHTLPFEIADGIRVVTPEALPRVQATHGKYALIGAGKTAMDVGVWLQQMGVAPDAIRWIAPRDSWLINRDTTQPGDAFFPRTMGGYAHQLEAAAGASDVRDLFDRLERTGQMLRIDRSVRPTMFRGATIALPEIELLRQIKDVVRKGHVRRIEPERIVLDRGVVQASPDWIYIDCTARAWQPAQRADLQR